MKKIITLFLAVLLNSCVEVVEVEVNTPSNQNQTTMQIFNHSKDTVLVYVTLGATPGCIQDVSLIPFITDTLQGGLQGTFTLAPNDSTIAYAPDSLGYNGVISFNYAPDNCTTPSYTNGLNQFEFIINNSFQAGNPQETIDISCVHGVNCVIRVDLLTNNYFNAGPTIPKIQSFANTMNRNEIGIAGVYPFGCDTCTGSKNPPSCIPLPQPHQTQSICNVQRNASQSGGLIKVIYLGQVNILK
ncbi:conserved hypothetical protein [Gammaproteobacteria bacterium]